MPKDAHNLSRLFTSRWNSAAKKLYTDAHEEGVREIQNLLLEPRLPLLIRLLANVKLASAVDSWYVTESYRKEAEDVFKHIQEFLQGAPSGDEEHLDGLRQELNELAKYQELNPPSADEEVLSVSRTLQENQTALGYDSTRSHQDQVTASTSKQEEDSERADLVSVSTTQRNTDASDENGASSHVRKSEIGGEVSDGLTESTRRTEATLTTAVPAMINSSVLTSTSSPVGQRRAFTEHVTPTARLQLPTGSVSDTQKTPVSGPTDRSRLHADHTSPFTGRGEKRPSPNPELEDESESKKIKHDHMSDPS